MNSKRDSIRSICDRRAVHTHTNTRCVISKRVFEKYKKTETSNAGRNEKRSKASMKRVFSSPSANARILLLPRASFRGGFFFFVLSARVRFVKRKYSLYYSTV